MDTTKVLFRVFPEGDIIAIFPDEVWSGNGNDLASYQHVGQHGACSPELINELRAALPREYKPLLKELKRIGYADLEVISSTKDVRYCNECNQVEEK